jgi:putative ABC transport system substrate-binding protein
MMYEIVPAVPTVAALVDAKSPSAERQTNDIQKASENLGRSVRVLYAASESEIDDAFTRIVQEKLGALFVSADAYFSARRAQIVALAGHYAIPAFYPRSEFAEAGGLASYGTKPDATFRQGGIYVGRILKGDKPADLPVVQASKLELVINLKTAKALGLTIPETLLATADEVIQ